MPFLINRLKALPFALVAFVAVWFLPKSFRDGWGAAIFVTLLWVLFLLWDQRNYFWKSKPPFLNWAGLILSLVACLFTAELVKGRFVHGRRNTYVPLGLYVGSAAFWMTQLMIWLVGRTTWVKTILSQKRASERLLHADK